MHVLEPQELERRKQLRGKAGRKRRKLPLRSFVILVLTVYLAVSLLLPAPALVAKTTQPAPELSSASPIPWPVYGQAAVGAVGYGLLAKNGDQKQAPIASMAKVVTALAVLKVKPMKPNSFGEDLTITIQDVETYFAYSSQGQSVVRVQAGQNLTQYEALQALLLPSANNMADVMVRWAFGTTSEYLAFVNPFVATLGLNNTEIADASGFSPQTVSTAEDLVKLAEIAMNHPLIAAIVAQPQAEIPVAGTVYNVNYQLGTAGIVGIKTGNTDQAGGCYMFASKRAVKGSDPITVVGVVMGAPVLSRAITDSLPLIEETFKRFTISQPFETGQVVGSLHQTNGSSSNILVETSMPIMAWSGIDMRTDFAMKELGSQLDAHEEVGTVIVEVGNKTYQMKLIAEKAIQRLSPVWRLRHLGGLI